MSEEGRSGQRMGDTSRMRENWEAAMDLVEVESDPDLDFEDRIGGALDVLTDRSRFPIAYLTHIDDDVVELQAVRDDYGNEAISEGTTTRLSQTYCRYVVSEEEELTVLEAGEDIPRDGPVYHAYGFERYVGIPVRVGGSLFGTICLADPDGTGGRPTDECKSLLRLVATWVGVQLQRQEERRLTAVLQRVLRHNLRNSLNIIRGYADTMPPRPECLPGLRIIREEAQSLQGLTREAQEIEALLREQTTRTTLELDSLIEEIVANTRRANPDATLEIESTASVTVRAISQLGLALEELLTNAIDHAEREDPTVTVSAAVDEHNVTVQIADEGPGIPENELLPLEGSVQIDPINHGSGLGLWLVRLVVQQSGGTMSVADRDPRGTVVSVRLPRNESDRPE